RVFFLPSATISLSTSANRACVACNSRLDWSRSVRTPSKIEAVWVSFDWSACNCSLVCPAVTARSLASRKLSNHSKMTQPKAQQSTSTMDKLKIVGMRWRGCMTYPVHVLHPEKGSGPFPTSFFRIQTVPGPPEKGPDPFSGPAVHSLVRRQDAKGSLVRIRQDRLRIACG